MKATCTKNSFISWQVLYSNTEFNVQIEQITADHDFLIKMGGGGEGLGGWGLKLRWGPPKCSAIHALKFSLIGGRGAVGPSEPPLDPLIISQHSLAF